ncbi:hypothetical protein RRG08_060635 [Elysia crispata]|uniref:Uncharacterized protein n=1 Tax=Elysia crispata TaxID=231223 RepID=A0AAE0XMP2_9GAST|nr:hypothetical protein RRG08_060635 [Elysia crispata]
MQIDKLFGIADAMKIVLNDDESEASLKDLESDHDILASSDTASQDGGRKRHQQARPGLWQKKKARKLSRLDGSQYQSTGRDSTMTMDKRRIYLHINILPTKTRH